MNSFQKAALQATTETITEESFETGLTVGHGTSVQHFAIKPLPASSQQVASKCWSKSCKASLVWEFSSAELTVTALAWHCTSANLNLDLAKILQNAMLWAPNLKLKKLLKYSLYLNKKIMTH